MFVLVSLSMPLSGLIDLGKQAQKYGGVLVLRGLVQGSYLKTAAALKTFIHKTGTGLLVAPELFRQCKVRAVPAIVLLCSSSAFDKISGFIPVQTALEKMAIDGDLKEEARQLLNKVSLKGQEKSS